MHVIADMVRADAILSLFDAWVANPKAYALPGRKWLAWTPVDQAPLAPGMDRLLSATVALPFSQWGTEQLNAVLRARPETHSVQVAHLPLGVDLGRYQIERPERRAEQREKMGLPKD